MFSHHTELLGSLGCLAIAALIATGIASPVRADDDSDLYTASTTVNTQGLDLNSTSDQALLRARIEHAVRKVCGLYDGQQTARSASYVECHDVAMADASNQMNMLVARAKTATLVATSTPTQP